MKEYKPSDFTFYPWDSIFQNLESEVVALNIMQILQRTGNKFRELSWDEYVIERKKDFKTDRGGGFKDYAEQPYFEKVKGYCTSADKAVLVSPEWAKLSQNNNYGTN